MRCWRALNINQIKRFKHESVEAFLIDSPPKDGIYGGTGESYDWTLVKGLSSNLILAGGLDGSNVAQAIRTAQPWGVDACSRLESTPGKKDHVKMAQFLKAALNGL